MRDTHHTTTLWGKTSHHLILTAFYFWDELYMICLCGDIHMYYKKQQLQGVLQPNILFSNNIRDDYKHVYDIM